VLQIIIYQDLSLDINPVKTISWREYCSDGSSNIKFIWYH